MSAQELKTKLRILDSAIEHALAYGSPADRDACGDLIEERNEVLNLLIREAA
jgi:hypothetical protein